VAPIVIASNRGPYEFVRAADGRLQRRRSGGGLAAILSSATDGLACTWLAAAVSDADRTAAAVGDADRAVVDGADRTVAAVGDADRAAAAGSAVGDAVTDVVSLRFDPGTYRAFYQDVSTRILWFLHHHLPIGGDHGDAALTRSWEAYRVVNEAFARACGDAAAHGGEVLLQDYHLALAPRMLRECRPDLRIAHSVACPWADPATYRWLPAPVAAELLDGMLGADLVTFFADRWAVAFLDCCADAGYDVDPGARTVRARDGRSVRVGAFPVGVAEPQLRRLLASAEARAYRSEITRAVRGRRLVLRIDRMEPTKNILRGLAAYRLFLERHPGERGTVTHYVLAYGSRRELVEYRRYDRAVRHAVDEINATFATADWRPVVLETRNNVVRGLVAAALADVLVVNTLRDGMNLVAKEGPVVSEGAMALILSAEAGAAADLADHALVVDPLDVEQLAARIAEALHMPVPERERRLRLLRAAATACPPATWLASVRDELAAAHTRPPG
jgi:trehalose 6-phosphate synthase